MPNPLLTRGRALAALLCLAHGGPALAASHGPRSLSTVPETYISEAASEDELDSLATWRHPDGTVWVIATGKSSHRLVVFDADTGTRLRTVGGKGGEPGQFKRPNGIAVVGDRLFVVERDNHRVQVFSLPNFEPLGSFGDTELRSPYGIWIRPHGRGKANGNTIELYVTDGFMNGPRFEVVPPLDQLDERVRRYRLRFDATGAFAAESLGHFGATDERDALRVVESIAGDTAHDRLLIADEYQPQSTLREYTLDGRATGRHIPENTFSFEAEGVALWACSRDKGYWIAVDQLAPLTVFHFFDRNTLALRRSFSGRTIAETDGIALLTAPSKRFPSGALFAVHRDQALAAFDLRDIARMLKLPASCM